MVAFLPIELDGVLFVAILVLAFGLIRIHLLIDYATNLSINQQARHMSRLLDLQPLPGVVRGDLVASCTTTVGRLGTLAIESILFQTVRPARVMVYLSKNIPFDAIPDSVLRLCRYGVELRFVDDVGPHTKLIYALRDFPAQTIVTFDDDIYYPANTIETLIDASAAAPSAIVGNWVRRLRFGWNGKVRKARAGKLMTPESQIVSIERGAKPLDIDFANFAYGTSGVLYPPDCFDARVFDIEAMRRLCPNEDDVWFKAMSLLKGTPVAATALGLTPKHHCLQGSQKIALRHRNHAANGKAAEHQIQAVFEHYGLYERLKVLQAQGTIKQSVQSCDPAPDLAHEDLRLLTGGEVPALLSVTPINDVSLHSLSPLAGRLGDFARKSADGTWQVDFTRHADGNEAFPLHPGCRGTVAGEPVEQNAAEYRVHLKGVFGPSGIVGPGPHLFVDSRCEANETIDEAVAYRLRVS